MIGIVYGTTAEVIKLAPVLTRLRDRGTRYLNVTTAQQVEQIPALLEQLGLPQPDLWLARGAGGRDLRSNADIPRWLGSVGTSFTRHRRDLRRQLGERPLLLVHGDTMTTVLGSLMGRALRVPVAHVEAGLRTGDLRHPFPEELNRRLVSRIATIHYAPGPQAAAAVAGRDVVDTGTNTIRDAIELALGRSSAPLRIEPPYGIASLHRYELLRDRRLLRETIELLARAAESVPILWIDHPVTIAALERFGLDRAFSPQGLRRIPRLDFFGFVELLRNASFLVTDSGGSQVETYFLDVPCLVHRKGVEQPEGVGENVVLSGFSLEVLAEFLRDPAVYRRRGPLPTVSPADVIVADLVRRGFV